jgi:hypothetical protein
VTSKRHSQLKGKEPLSGLKLLGMALCPYVPLLALFTATTIRISVVIEPGASLIRARLRASIDGPDQGDFTEARELDRKWRVPKAMIGRRLSQEESPLIFLIWHPVHTRGR